MQFSLYPEVKSYQKSFKILRMWTEKSLSANIIKNPNNTGNLTWT